MSTTPSVIVRCKGCNLIIHPLPTRPTNVRGVHRVRFEYQCENPDCDQTGYTQHRTQPIKVEAARGS